VRRATGDLDPLHRVPEQEAHASFRAEGRQGFGEHARVAAFVAGGVGAADDAVRERPECGLDGQQLVARDHAALDAEVPHQRRGLRAGVQRGRVGEEVPRNFRPQRHCCQSSCGRNSSGASARSS
jgi:hypothetical protein